MARLRDASWALAVAGWLAACDASDFGQPCPALLGATAPQVAVADPTTRATVEVVEQNAAFPCEQLTCIASAGSSGYCSGKCLDDTACPQGLSCRIVQPSGTFAGQMFCAFKACDTAGDCGPKKDFCCTGGGGAGGLTGRCAFSRKGKCP